MVFKFRFGTDYIYIIKMEGAVQATKLNVKLFDQVEDEVMEAEAKNPRFGVLGLFFFMVVFLGVCMSRFRIITSELQHKRRLHHRERRHGAAGHHEEDEDCVCMDDSKLSLQH